MKSFIDSIYHFQYVLFFIQWTLTLSLALGAYIAIDKAYFWNIFTFYVVFMTQIPAPSLLERSRKTVEMIKFRPKTEEELKQPSAPATDKTAPPKPADSKKRVSD